MLKRDDELWLAKTYPALLPSGAGVEGVIAFTATYNSRENRFLILRDGVADSVGGLALSGEFRIRIKERDIKAASALPAVYLDDVDAIVDRHFGQADKSACLCSPLEEGEFLEPEFRFVPFLERLVIPFLYGQLFYSQNGRWPWSEYAHGSTGLLEAYGNATGPTDAADLLRRLALDRHGWPRIRAALKQEPYVKGHTLCFCLTPDQIKRCHPLALRGALRLQRDVRAQSIPIPPAG